MAFVYKESLIAVCFRLVLFWWLTLTGVAILRGEWLSHMVLSVSEYGFLESVDIYFYSLYERVWYLVATTFFSIIGVGLYVYLRKERVVFDLAKRSALGVSTWMGPVPVTTEPLPRVSSVSQRLPVCNQEIAMWLLTQNVPVDEIIPEASVRVKEGKFKAKNNDSASLVKRRAELNAIVVEHDRYVGLASNDPHRSKRKPMTAHGRLFLAVWDTFCKHKHYPASHRVGGHGAVKLHEHCMSVAARCLFEVSKDGGDWKYDGVYVKWRGRNAVKFLENHTGYQPNSDDPLIPIIGLAHDIGKLLAYDVNKKGEIRKNLEPEANTLVDDNKGVIHDVLGPRILSRMPEFWALPPGDRSVINTAIAHYHHPSQFPVNSYGMADDARAAALMALLIASDRRVSALESGVDPDVAPSTEMTTDEAEELYKTFVGIVTTYGRINGVGRPADDAKIRIGQKHESFIAIKMSALLELIRKELNVSLESGENKHTLTNNLLGVLKEKGLLYTTHKNIDFSDCNPLFRVGLYHHGTTKHIVDLAPALLMVVPPVEMEELYALSHLALNPCNVIVKNLILSHIPKHGIKNSEDLINRIEEAFGADESQADLHKEIDDDAGMITEQSEIQSAESDESGIGETDSEGKGTSAPHVTDEEAASVETQAENLGIDTQAAAEAAGWLKKRQKANRSKQGGANESSDESPSEKASSKRDVTSLADTDEHMDLFEEAMYEFGGVDFEAPWPTDEKTSNSSDEDTSSSKENGEAIENSVSQDLVSQSEIITADDVLMDDDDALSDEVFSDVVFSDVQPESQARAIAPVVAMKEVDKTEEPQLDSENNVSAGGVSGSSQVYKPTAVPAKQLNEDSLPSPRQASKAARKNDKSAHKTKKTGSEVVRGGQTL